MDDFRKESHTYLRRHWSLLTDHQLSILAVQCNIDREGLDGPTLFLKFSRFIANCKLGEVRKFQRLVDEWTAPSQVDNIVLAFGRRLPESVKILTIPTLWISPLAIPAMAKQVRLDADVDTFQIVYDSKATQLVFRPNLLILSPAHMGKHLSLGLVESADQLEKLRGALKALTVQCSNNDLSYVEYLYHPGSGETEHIEMCEPVVRLQVNRRPVTKTVLFISPGAYQFISGQSTPDGDERAWQASNGLV